MHTRTHAHTQTFIGLPLQFLFYSPFFSIFSSTFFVLLFDLFCLFLRSFFNIWITLCCFLTVRSCCCCRCCSCCCCCCRLRVVHRASCLCAFRFILQCLLCFVSFCAFCLLRFFVIVVVVVFVFCSSISFCSEFWADFYFSVAAPASAPDLDLRTAGTDGSEGQRTCRCSSMRHERRAGEGNKERKR